MNRSLVNIAITTLAFNTLSNGLIILLGLRADPIYVGTLHFVSGIIILIALLTNERS